MSRDAWRHRAAAALRAAGLAACLATAAGASPALPLPPGVQRLADVPYGSDPRQRFDVYLPAHPEHAPLIVMVHGGAWMVGNKAMPQVVDNKVARWCAGASPDRGEGAATRPTTGARNAAAIFVSVGYRLSPQADPLAQAHDVARAIARVQQLAPQWGGDPDRLVLMGHSAGAHLVALLGASPTLARSEGARPWLGTVALDSAALDLPALMQRRHAPFYDRVFGSDPAAWRAASPADVLAAGAPPMLLVCSTRRADDSCGQATSFAARATALGVQASVSGQNLTHAEINDTLGLPGRETEAVQAFFERVGAGIG